MTKVTAFPGARRADVTVEEQRETAARVCRNEMDAASLSIAQAAHQMGRGVSTATLSKWLRGVYEGDVPAVTERVVLWLATRSEARSRDMTAAGLDRHVALGVTEGIEATLGHAQATGDVVLVHGRSGCGKSWAVTRYCNGHTAAYQATMTDAVATIAGLLDRVAEAVGAGTGHPSALAAERAVVSQLEGRSALLCIDEAHHLRPKLLDELRCIRDLAGCGLAYIGEDDLWNALNKSARCDQIIGRIGVRLPLGRAADADVLDLARSVLGRSPTKGERKHLAAAAHAAGGLHALRRLFARAWLLARAAGREDIQADDLAAATEQAA